MTKCSVLPIIFIVFFSFLSGKTVLVTGGAGFIGGHVVEKLLQQGDRVIVVDSFYGNDSLVFMKEKQLRKIVKNYPELLSVYRTDICNKQEMEKIFELHKIDVICHLAARAGVRDSILYPDEYIKTNILGTLIVFELAKKYQVTHVVFASSSSVYGERKRSELFQESDRTDAQSSPYGMTKKAGELLAFVFYYLYQLPITCLRFFTVYGPRGRQDMAPYIFMDAIYHERSITVYGNGSAIRDFTYIDDIVDGIIKALDKPLEFEIINLGRGEPVTVQYFLDEMQKIMNKEVTIVHAPIIAGDVYQTRASIVHARETLGYDPKISVSEGIEKMYEWYKAEQERIEQ
jgi:UDP-glucuronate 4-epimerase